MKIRQLPQRGAVLQVLAVLAGTCLLGLALVALAIYETVTVGADMRSARNAVLRDVHLHFSRCIEVTAHPALVSLARFGLSFAPLEPEARLAVRSIRGAEVGVYQLTSRPDDAERRALFRKVDERLEKRGWARSVAVLDHDDLVMVYTPRKEMPADDIKAFVIVLDDRQLVFVSGKGNLEPIAELVAEKIREHPPGPLFGHGWD